MKQGRLFAVLCVVIAAIGTNVDRAPAAEEEAKLDPELEAILKEEKAHRKACKVKICSILRNKSREGADVACNVIKTWPKPDLDKIVSKARVSWPWGHTRCVADIKVKRAVLVDAMTEPTYEAKFDEHQVNCEIERKKKGETYTFKISVTPTVTFENGKAKKAVLKWGELDAPTIAKGVIWPATALDNKLNVFGGEVVDVINTFAAKKCDEVKDEISASQ
ncbi:MAG: hypothetical protein V3V97_04695 [Hyphomicrobiaceae bacterium]